MKSGLFIIIYEQTGGFASPVANSGPQRPESSGAGRLLQSSLSRNLFTYRNQGRVGRGPEVMDERPPLSGNTPKVIKGGGM